MLTEITSYLKEPSNGDVKEMAKKREVFEQILSFAAMNAGYLKAMDLEIADAKIKSVQGTKTPFNAEDALEGLLGDNYILEKKKKVVKETGTLVSLSSYHRCPRIDDLCHMFREAMNSTIHMIPKLLIENLGSFQFFPKRKISLVIPDAIINTLVDRALKNHNLDHLTNIYVFPVSSYGTLKDTNKARAYIEQILLGNIPDDDPEEMFNKGYTDVWMKHNGKIDNTKCCLIPSKEVSELTRLIDGSGHIEIIGPGGNYEKSGRLFRSDLKDIKAYTGGIGDETQET